MHAGWAAQSGLRAALMARAGFSGPRTVFEGTHGLFHGFAHTIDGNYDALLGDFGTRWVTETLAFKPYPCGTMTHPYIDCARRLAARGIKPEDITDIVCDVGEGTVHRLWEPLAAKQRPANGYAGKFSQPYCIATGLVRGNVGLGDFTDAAVKDPRVLARCREGPLPHRSGTIPIRTSSPATSARRSTDGSVVEERQPHFRGGAKEPLTRADIEDKFALNCRHGGWDDAQDEDRRWRWRKSLYDGRIDLKGVARVSAEKELVGRVALVTGAGRNIGRAMAKALAAGGAAVIVNVRSNKAEAEQVVREIERDGGKAIAAVADVGDEKAVVRDGRRTPRSSSAASTISINNAALRQERALRGDVVQGMARRARRHARRRVPLRQGLPAVSEGRAARARSSTSAACRAHTGSKHRAHVTAAKLGLVGFTRGLAHDLAERPRHGQSRRARHDRHARAIPLPRSPRII